MNISTHSLFSRAGMLVASALLWIGASQLRAEEALSTTAAQIDEAAEHEDGAGAADRIGTKFTTFAGSNENATALVTGLRNGTSISLTTTVEGQPVTTEFQPAGEKLGFGNTFIALGLARESLAKAGIMQPSPAQIEAALNGGTVTGGAGEPVTLPGVLTLRAAGNGWGDIAQTLDVKLGRVVSALHRVHQEFEFHDRMEHPERQAFAAKSDPSTRGMENRGKPDHIGRPMWAAQPNLPNPGHFGRPGRP